MSHALAYVEEDSPTHFIGERTPVDILHGAHVRVLCECKSECHTLRRAEEGFIPQSRRAASFKRLSGGTPHGRKVRRQPQLLRPSHRD